jgi:GDP-L-fucose synthase
MADRSLEGKRVLVTGAGGFVGTNLVQALAEKECTLLTPSRSEYDLTEQSDVRAMFAELKPEIVFHCAGLVGGILVNKTYPADFCYQNLVMGTMVMHEAYASGVTKYISLMGGCSYPANAENPIAETALWNGYPQKESASYSLAKAMSVVQAQSYRDQYGFNAVVLVPGNIYGPHDNFDLQGSHVIPALIRKYHEAKLAGTPEVVAWGTGAPVRDFIYIGDACDAIIRAAESYDGREIINISSGQPVTIRELTEMVADVTDYRGRVSWDTSKPDGQMLKGFDVTRMREWLDFHPPTSLREGLRLTAEWFVANYEMATVAPV